MDAALRTLAPDGKPAPPEVVADAIVSVAEDDNARLRHLVGADAELIWSVRNGSDFEQYEADDAFCSELLGLITAARAAGLTRSSSSQSAMERSSASSSPATTFARDGSTCGCSR